MTLRELIAQLKSAGACLEPVDDARQDLEGIPFDYQEFLRIANGLQVSGLRLLGTKPMRLAGGQVEPDIFASTQAAKDLDRIEQGVVLGHISSDLLIIYGENGHHYELLDKSCGDVLYSFQSLLEVLERWKNWHPHLFHA